MGFLRNRKGGRQSKATRARESTIKPLSVTIPFVLLVAEREEEGENKKKCREREKEKSNFYGALSLFDKKKINDSER